VPFWLIQLFRSVVRCLALNSLQPDVWFRLGAAALRIEDFKTSAAAYRRKVEIDADVSMETELTEEQHRVQKTHRGTETKTDRERERAVRFLTAPYSQDFESWNNLANCYIKLDQKPRALLALKESVKCEYENWKVRELFVC
jgi:tetratricopeptide (TPR) repeat protein